MIWVALLIGVAVLLAIRLDRGRPAKDAAGASWQGQVLPDEPAPGEALALPGSAASTLTVLATVYPSWSGAEQSWRAEKPMRPWFLGAAPCAIAMALGVISLDPTAAGLGVPEIFPTHVAVHHNEQSHGHSDPAGVAAFTLPDSFAAWSSEPVGDLAGWTPAEASTVSWEPLHQSSHDWWA